MSADVLLSIDGAPLVSEEELAPVAFERRIALSCVPTKRAQKQIKLNDLQQHAGAVDGRATRKPGNGRAYKRKVSLPYAQDADIARPTNIKKKAYMKAGSK